MMLGFSRRFKLRHAAALLPIVAMVATAALIQSSEAASPSVVTARLVASYAPPGVGAYWRNILKTHSQVIVGDGIYNNTNVIQLTLWTYVGVNKWRNDGSYTASGGANGWGKTRQGDRKSPTGVYGLTDAGGYYPNPGTQLPYQYSPHLYSYVYHNVRVFSYVVSINYNHVVGTPPSSTRTPGPYSWGSQIWLHQRTGLVGTSLGCVGTTRVGMVRILRWLNPKSHPVILMAPHSTIVRAR